MKQILLFLAVFFFAHSAIAAEDNIEVLLKKRLPNAKIKRLEANNSFADVFEILLEQPLDHNNPKAGTFQHRLFLHHRSRKAPMVFVTEGYSANERVYELPRLLNANQLTVEYRFFGASQPKKIDWQYLTNDQAIEDLHRIRKLFKKIYRKKWIATGISKGGTTTLIYKSKYPKDVRVAVPYVAPLALAQEDKRTDEHIKNRGTVACRDKLFDFQRLALERRDELIPMIKKKAKKNKEVYSIGFDAVLEYAVLEFTFSFWQWGGKCEDVPGRDADTKAIFDYLERVVSFNFYSDATYEYYKPAFYQFMTELGYYGFITDHLEDLLKKNTYSNQRFGPQGVDLSYKPYLQSVVNFLDKKGKRIIYIYGADDPWTACGYQPKEGIDALRMDLENGSHFTRISSFSKEDQKKIMKKLKKWL